MITRQDPVSEDEDLRKEERSDDRTLYITITVKHNN